MKLEEMRKRIQEIVAKLDEFSAVGNYTQDDVEAINALNDEFETLSANIEASEKIEAMKAKSAAPKRQVAPAQPRVEVKASRLDKNMGFENLGELSKALVAKSRGNIDPRFQNTAAYEKFSEDGGILIPEEFVTSISKKVMGDQSLLPRTNLIPISGNSLTIPTNENSPWSGGVQAYWTEEGGTITESKESFKSSHIRLHKLAALVKVTDELLEDATALQSYINASAPAAILNKINDAIINGDGVAKPQGILSSGFTVSIAKESAQTADTIVYKNLVKMVSAHVGSANSVWLVHPSCKQQLLQLEDGNGNAIYMNGGQFANLSVTPYDMLLGKPVIYMMGGLQTLGDKGDIMLVDLKYYNAIVKSGIKQDISTHLLFDQAMTAFRFITRVGGSCPYQSPITTQNGSFSMSGLVTLDAR